MWKLEFLYKSLIIAVVLCFTCSTLKAQSDSVLYSFFVAGHVYGGQGGNSNKGVHSPFKQKFTYLKSIPKIEFGVLLGDIVPPNPVEKDWEEVEEDLRTLGIPVRYVVGNHDMENRPVFEQRYGRTYYSYYNQEDLFIVLDPYLDGWNISGDQLSFLKKTLNENDSELNNIFVFFYPILWNSIDNDFNYIHWNSDAGRTNEVNFWTEVEPLFYASNNPVTFFAGDLGASWSVDFSYDQYDNITLISTGMGDPDGENFLIANVLKDNTIDYELICLSDSNLHCFGKTEDYLVINSPQVKRENTLIPYPNPTDDVFTLILDRDETYDIQMYTVQGNLVLSQRVESTAKHRVSTRHLESGLYFVRIVGYGEQTVKGVRVR